VPNLIIVGIGVAREEVVRGKDHTGGAETALQAMLVPETLLKCMQVVAAGQAFNGRDFRFMSLHRELRTGFHCLTVDEYGASTTDARLTAYVSACQPQGLAQVVHEQGTCLYLMGMVNAINPYHNPGHPASQNVRVAGATVSGPSGVI
jgi:hypothetical protein